MQTATFDALRTAAGAALLAEATAAYGREDGFALGTRLRRTHDPDLVAAALTQARLRARATDKFAPADAARMFFTVDGYEQATRVAVARHRAARLATALGPGAAVADLCCGVGGDLVELARAGLTVTGVDVDPLTADMATANAEALGVRAEVVCADATTVDRTAYAAVVCDPARRGGRGRVFDPDAYRPPWSFVLELLAGTACVKVAPGLPHERIPGRVEAEWVSERGEVKEAALWSGGLAGDGARVGRRATLLPSGATLTDRDDPGPVVRPLGEFLYEPDGAVIRAGLVTAAAARVGGGLIDPSIAYVTADAAVSTPFARGYLVLDTLPYDVKALRRYVRDHGIGVLTVKKRGVGVEPEKLRAAVRPRGDRTATFVVTRVAGTATVIVADPL
ncbi:class I SAM-dependent methyltransferase [Jiangella alkaliphila]|uniref:Methyltransferase domain-containing protein n=1 Tax=Jiangella alkaliphila TaxID=419479 RepID=A0A1H2M5W1_9ACTN|nr:methyltransferase domain-containing protein [Jiangella alkaliphila]SDU88559.1 Methyltransferase domain-containing protein [Jiangella alkaliphila]